jgi:hypothetical protein
VHGFVVLVVLVQLGFAIAFLVDAARTNNTYDALVSHRVAVRGHAVECVTIAPVASSKSPFCADVSRELSLLRADVHGRHPVR